MPGLRVVTPPEGEGSELYTGVAGPHGHAHMPGLGNPAKGSATWAWPELTGMVNQGPVAWPVTSRGYGESMWKSAEVVWSFSAASPLVELTRIPPAWRLMGPLEAVQDPRSTVRRLRAMIAQSMATGS